MTFSIFTNPQKENAIFCTQQVIKKLNCLGVNVLLPHYVGSLFNNLDFPVEYLSTENAIQQCDLILSVGGDGTLIHTAKQAFYYNKPVLGINAGRLGFLTNLEATDLSTLDSIAKGNYTVRKAMMLQLTHTTDEGQHTYYALNDIVITKGSLSRMVELSVTDHSSKLQSYRADGLIFSTPTGSTAYNLSAGGPIVEPSIECMIISPICPHSLSARSVVYAADKVLSVEIGQAYNDEIFITVDGETNISLKPTDTITIKKSEKFVSLVDLGISFFDILHQKFTKGYEV